MAPEEYLPARVNQHVAIVRAEKAYSPQYIMYWLQYMKPYLLAICKIGGTRNALTKEAVEEIQINYPPCASEIAKLLSSMDDVVRINKAIIAELEATTRLIFDYWFIQFEFPDENGNPYQSSGGKMVYSEELKREIPYGWQVGNFYQIAEYINGLACQKHRPEGIDSGLPVVKIKEMRNGISDDTERVSSNIPTSNKIEDGDLLFSWSASLEMHYWTGGDAGLNQHIFKVVPRSGFGKEYVYQTLSSYLHHFRKMAEIRKTTMGHITTDHLDQSRIAIPPVSIIDGFNRQVAQLRSQVLLLHCECKELELLRDWLLPMLMNGQAIIESDGVRDVSENSHP